MQGDLWRWCIFWKVKLILIFSFKRAASEHNVTKKQLAKAGGRKILLFRGIFIIQKIFPKKHPETGG